MKMPAIKPTHQAFALIAGVVSIPLSLGQYFYPSFSLVLFASLILRDVHRADKINPYRLDADLKVLFSNKWLVFSALYLFWVIDFAFIN